MSKKIIALLLVFTMALSLVSCTSNTASNDTGNEQDQQDQNENSNSGESGKPSGTITIGDVSGITGDFGGEDYGVGMGDVILFNLCHGYELISITADGNLEENKTVVKEKNNVTNDDGSITVTITLNKGLLWNNGEEIKAKDYVSSYLFRSCPAYGEAGAFYIVGTQLLGYDDFNSGKSKIFKGIHLLGDYEFSVTIDSSYCPAYFQDSYIRTYPIYLDSWAPGITVKDDGDGCYFYEDVTLSKIETATDAERRKPTITCGPYNLVNFDTSSLSGVFEINPNFAGNWEGQKPGIEKVIVKSMTKDTMMDELKTGSIDVLSGINDASKINSGLDMVDAGGFHEIHYPSVNLALLNFNCDFGPSQFISVRQAVTYAFDRNEFIKQMSGGYASISNGYYVDAAAPIQELGDKLESSLNQYSYNLDMAKKVLIDDGWTLNRSGDEYIEGTDDVRCKKLDDGTLMPLELNFVGTPDSKFVDVAIQMLSDSLPKIGAKFIPDQIDWALLLQHIYRQVDSKYNIFASGLTFNSPVIEPSWDFTIDEKYLGAGYNNIHMIDEKLYSLAKEMEKTDPSDRETFLNRYLAFQVRWNELLPSVPLYSGINYDFINDRVQDYAPSAYAFPDYAVLYAKIKEK